MITDKPIRVQDHMARVDPSCGALVTFTGVVRSPSNGREVTRISYDCYQEMAEKEMNRIVEEIKGDYAVDSVEVTHRVGDVAAGEISLLVVVSAAHRRAAFEATQAAVDELKRRVPIWKKEFFAGGEVWIEGQGAPEQQD